MNIRKKICFLLVAVMLFGCMNVPNVLLAETGDLGEGYDAQYEDTEFYTIDGDVVSTNSTGIVTVLIFTMNGCLNSTNLLNSLCAADWIDDDRFRVLVVDTDKSSKEDFTAFSEQFDCDELIYCYCENNTANNMMWSCYRSVLGSESQYISLPFVLIYDENNKIQYGFPGHVLAKDIRPYIEDLVGDTLVGKVKYDSNVDFLVEGKFCPQKAYEVWEQVNEARKEQGLEALQLDKDLVEAAMQRAAECSIYYSHTRPDGTSFSTALRGSDRQSCAENIAIGYSSSTGVMNGWMNSSGHYANIMGDYEAMGIGCFYHNGKYYWTQVFSGWNPYFDSATLEEEDYTKQTTVVAAPEYYGEATLDYEGDITVGKETPTQIKLMNPEYNAYFIASANNAEFKSSDERILTIATNGAITGVSPGAATVEIIVDHVSIGNVEITVKEAQKEIIELSIEGDCSEQKAYEVWEIVNAEREKQGLAPLKLDEELTKMAMQRAAECAVDLGHTRPDLSEWSTILDDVYLFACGENVAAGDKTSQGVMNGWMNSPGHYANIMNENYYQSIGIGCFEHNGVCYWTQLFSGYSEGMQLTKPEDYTMEAKIDIDVENMAELELAYDEELSVGKKTEAYILIRNGNTACSEYYIPSMSNISLSSLDENILTIDDFGTMTGVAEGEADIEISIGGIVIGTAFVTVNAAEQQPSESPIISEPSVTPGMSDDSEVSGDATEVDKNIDAKTGMRYGDSNKDGSITLQDAQVALRVALLLEEADEDAIRIMSGGETMVQLKHAQIILRVALLLQENFYV